MKEALQLSNAEDGERLQHQVPSSAGEDEKNVADWSRQYSDNQPFPHIGIDDFFDDRIIRDNIVTHYPGEYDASWIRTLLDLVLWAAKLSLDRQEDFPVFIQHFISALNSRAFVAFLEQLSGIDGLIPDS